jgi:hypothetical protein
LIPTCTLIISRHKFLQASAEANDDIAAPAATGNCHLDVKSREICKTRAAAVKKEGRKQGRKKVGLCCNNNSSKSATVVLLLLVSKVLYVQILLILSLNAACKLFRYY